MKNFLMPFLSDYRWFRKWYGGKWAFSYINLPLTDPYVWHPGWERPGCGLYWLKREDWSASGTPGKAMKSIMDQEVECTENACDWYGTVNDCLPDVDGEGTIGCPLCQAAVREVSAVSASVAQESK